MSPLRIGFAGLGMVSELHAAAISLSSDAVLAGVYDPDEELTNRRAQTWGCRTFGTYDSLVADPDIDAVFVLSPTKFHVAEAIVALRAGKHVLVEKPVGTSLEELEELASVAGESPGICVPGHNYAYVPEFRRIRRLARQGDLGDIRLFAAMFAIKHEETVASHYDGVMRLVMPHHIYLVHGILGLPASVSASITSPGWRQLAREDQASLLLDYPPLGTALLFATLGADDQSVDPWSFVVKVIGTQGSASGSWRAAVINRGIGSMSTGFGPYEEAYGYQLAAFVKAAVGDLSSIESTLADAIAVELVLSAAEASIRERRFVDLAGTGAV